MVYYNNIEAFESNKANAINNYFLLLLTHFTAVIIQCESRI